MSWRNVRVACVGGVIAALAVPACGGDSSNPSTGSGGNGGNAGSGSAGKASAGSAGKPVVVGPVECNTAMCRGVTIPIQDFTIPGCCADEATSRCGIDSTVLSMFGPTFEEACQPLAQPGELDNACPDSPEREIEGTGLNVKFAGCCRENHTCGFMLNTIGGIVPLGLGCVDSAPFVDGGVPDSCGGDIGAGGQAGAAGSTGSAGAAGEGPDSAGGAAGAQ